MQAAVVTVMLMAGACSDSGEPLPAPAPMMAAPVQSSSPTPEAPLFNPPYSGSSTYPSPAGGIYYHMGVFGHPQYTPVWHLRDCEVYYPGNYAQPYDYREIFNYPWHGPRPVGPGPAIEMEAAARGSRIR
jgi:hypothetical protein